MAGMFFAFGIYIPNMAGEMPSPMAFYALVPPSTRYG